MDRFLGAASRATIFVVPKFRCSETAIFGSYRPDIRSTPLLYSDNLHISSKVHPFQVASPTRTYLHLSSPCRVPRLSNERHWRTSSLGTLQLEMAEDEMAAQFALKAALRKSMNKTLRALPEGQLAEQCVSSLTLCLARTPC